MVKRLSIVAFATVSFFGIAQNRSVDGQNEIPVNTGIVTASLNPGNGYVENNHATGKMSNAPITENAPQLSPTATCNWTVSVYNPTGSGSGVTWTLKNSSGTTLLSGGPYASSGGYNDVKTINADEPLTFQITSGGDYPYYKVNNGSIDVVKGIMPQSTTKTFPGLQCGGTPPATDPCGTIVYTGENLANGLPVLAQTVANDFQVTNGTLNVNQVTIRIATNSFVDATLTFRNNNAGTPGTLIKTYTNLAPTSQTLVGTEYGFNVYDMVFDLPEDLPLSNGIYWLALHTTSTNSFWAIADEPANAAAYYSFTADAPWNKYTEGFDGAFTVRDKNCTPASGGCNWTVNVYGAVSASGTTWTLKDSSGTTLLSGGPYPSANYNDVKTVTAEGPLTFDMTTGFFNFVYYKINNGTIDVAKGLVSSDGSKTITGLECGGTPPPDPEPCTVTYAGSISDGIGSLSDYMLANDFVIPAGNSMNIDQMTFKYLGYVFTNATVNFYQNDAGAPGALIKSYTTLAPTSQTLVGSSFGYNVYETVFDLPSAVSLGEGTYWVGIKTTNGPNLWEASDEISNSLGYFLYDYGWGANGFGIDCAFELKDKTCDLAVSDLGKSSDLAYPNPVKDVLYLQTKAEIANVEVFNLVGQRVMKNTKISNGQINVKSLATGTYVFRINLKDGQVETFKVIKE